MDQPTNQTLDPGEERRRWVAFAVLVSVAGGTLLLGAALSTFPPGRQPALAPVESMDVLPPAEESGEAAVPSTAFDEPWPVAGAMDRLAERTATDLELMANETRGWTRQLAVLCDTASIENLLQSAGDSSSLRLLPTYVDNRACFRLCWGSYDSREQASAAADMPTHMRHAFPDPIPRRRDEVLE